MGIRIYTHNKFYNFMISEYKFEIDPETNDIFKYYSDGVHATLIKVSLGEKERIGYMIEYLFQKEKHSSLSIKKLSSIRAEREFVFNLNADMKYGTGDLYEFLYKETAD